MPRNTCDLELAVARMRVAPRRERALGVVQPRGTGVEAKSDSALRRAGGRARRLRREAAWCRIRRPRARARARPTRCPSRTGGRSAPSRLGSWPRTGVRASPVPTRPTADGSAEAKRAARATTMSRSASCMARCSRTSSGAAPRRRRERARWGSSPPRRRRCARRRGPGSIAE